MHPPGTPATVVFLHGHDDRPDADALTPAGPASADDPGWTVVAPAGPVATTDARRAWWRSDDDGAPLAADVEAAVAIVDDAVRRYAADGPVVVGGFSQGGAFALALALRPEPGAIVGAFALGAWLPDLPGVALDLTGTAGRGLPVFVGHGTDDEAVDLLLGRGAARSLDRAGVPVTFAALEAGHEVRPFLAPLAAWTAQVLAGDRPVDPPR
jgi:predicted esterase